MLMMVMTVMIMMMMMMMMKMTPLCFAVVSLLRVGLCSLGTSVTLPRMSHDDLSDESRASDPEDPEELTPWNHADGAPPRQALTTDALPVGGHPPPVYRTTS